MTQDFVVHSGPFAGGRLSLSIGPRERVALPTDDGRSAIYQHCGWAEEDHGSPGVVFLGWDAA